MVGQIVGYGRVSSVSQNEARQVEALNDCDRVFSDEASGKNIELPELVNALDYVREGDTLRVLSMDRLARNALDLLTIVKALTERGVTVAFIKEKVLSLPTGTACIRAASRRRRLTRSTLPRNETVPVSPRLLLNETSA